MTPGHRWVHRPKLAAVVRVALFLVPVVASVAAATLVGRMLHRPTSGPGWVLWWVAVLAASLVVLAVVDRLARRVLPLATLLKLSLVFPDRAPSRMGVALRAGSTTKLRDRALAAAQRGDTEPALAAQTVLSLAATLNAHDRATRGHSERVRAYADLIAEELGLDDDDRDRLRWASLLHDVGKIGVPAHTLNQSEPLTPQEWDVLRRHPEEGARLVGPLRAWLGPWVLAIEQHHERYDGGGYPHGVKGDDLSLAARIVAVADSFDAMTSTRSYSHGVTPEVARQELARQAGSHFDPVVVRAFLNVGIGRLRAVMGPLALLGLGPVALRFRPISHALDAAGRTIGVATATLVATVALAQPDAVRGPMRAPAPHAAVAGQQVERVPEVALEVEAGDAAEPVSVPVIGGPAPEAVPERPTEVLSLGVVRSSRAVTLAPATRPAPDVAAPPAGLPADPSAQPASVSPQTQPGDQPQPQRPADSEPRTPEQQRQPQPEAPPPASSPGNQPEDPPASSAGKEPEEPAASSKPPPCEARGRSSEHAPACPPARFGHTEAEPPHGGRGRRS